MKKLLTALSLLLVTALLIPMTALAAVDSPEADIYTQAVVDGGEVALTGAPDAEEMEDYDSYELIVDETPVLTVEQSAAALTGDGGGTAFFTTRFALPDTTKEVFLAGLTAEKVEEIQNKLITSYASSSDFDLEDLSFIDAEKTNTDNDGDDELCWAAASSNILTYTGWAAQAGFDTTDDVLEAFIDAFDDKGGNPFYGVGWFFNGVNYFAQVNADAASAADNTGAFLNDYAFEQLVERKVINGNAISGMRALRESLDEGCGATLSISLYYRASGAYSNGHSVTCWGYVVDTAFGEDEAGYNAGLMLADSDSDKTKPERREAPNILHVVSLTSSGGGVSYRYNVDKTYYGVLDEFIRLKPYSADIPKETSAEATRNKTATADIYVMDAYLDTDTDNSKDNYVRTDTIESGTPFYFTPVIANESGQAYSGNTKITITATDSEGTETNLFSFNYDLSVDPTYYTYFLKYLTYDGLSEDDYTVTMTVNPEHTVPEAYYYNNSYSFPLKVRDSYLLGDADGSGIVDILDATLIQRALADYTINAERYMERACLDGGTELDITFATVIQRYLAEYDVSYPIGDKQLYR